MPRKGRKKNPVASARTHSQNERKNGDKRRHPTQDLEGLLSNKQPRPTPTAVLGRRTEVEDGEEEEKMEEADGQIEDAGSGKRRRKGEEGSLGEVYDLAKLLDEDFLFMEKMKEDHHAIFEGSLKDRYDGIKKLITDMRTVVLAYNRGVATADDMRRVATETLIRVDELPKYNEFESGTVRTSKKQRKRGQEIQQEYSQFETITPESAARANQEGAQKRDYEYPEMSNNDEQSRQRRDNEKRDEETRGRETAMMGNNDEQSRQRRDRDKRAEEEERERARERETAMMGNNDEQSRKRQNYDKHVEEEEKKDNEDWDSRWLENAAELGEIENTLEERRADRRRKPEMMEESKGEEEANLDAMRAEEAEQRSRKLDETVKMVDGHSTEELERQAKEAKRIERLLEIRQGKFYDASENVTKMAKQYKRFEDRLGKLDKETKELKAEQKKMQTALDKKRTEVAKLSKPKKKKPTPEEEAERVAEHRVAQRELAKMGKAYFEHQRKMSIHKDKVEKMQTEQKAVKDKMLSHKEERNAIHSEVTEFLRQLDNVMDESEEKDVGYKSAIKMKADEAKSIAKEIAALKTQIAKQNKVLAQYDSDPDKIVTKSSSKDYKVETEKLEKLTKQASVLEDRRASVLASQRKLKIFKEIKDAFIEGKINGAKTVVRQRMQLDLEKPSSALSRYQDYEKQIDQIDKALDKLKADQGKTDLNEADYKALGDQIDQLVDRSKSLNLGLDDILLELKKEFPSPETYMSLERYGKKPGLGEEENLYNSSIKSYDAKIDRIDKLKEELTKAHANLGDLDVMTPEKRKKYVPMFEELKKLEREAAIDLEGVQALEKTRKESIKKDIQTAEDNIKSSFRDLLDNGQERSPVRTGVKWEEMYSLMFEIEGMIKSDGPHDSKWRKALKSKGEKLHKLSLEGRHSQENPDPLRKREVLEERQKALKSAKEKYTKKSLMDDDEHGNYAFGDDFKKRYEGLAQEAEADYKRQDQKVQMDIWKKLRDRVYDGESIGDYTDAVVRVRTRMVELFKEMQKDVSANGPIIMQQAKMIYDRFQAMIKGATPQMIKEFNDALNDEKNEFLMQSAKEMREVSQKLYEKEGDELYASSKNPLLVDYLMDPLSFAEGNKRTMLLNTKLGIAWTETHRLVGLLQRQFDLRQEMMPLWEHINIVDEGVDGGKFDLVFTHLFPPSVVDMKLRMLKMMSAEQRKQIENGPFMQAIKAIDPKFDINGLSGENFIDVVVKLQSGAENYVKGVAESGGFPITDIIVRAEEIERSKALILAQVDPKLDPALQLDPSANKALPEGQMPLDPDSGASPPDAQTGEILNKTFNPIVQGQLTRDMIDDAKRQQFMLLEQQHMSLSLQTVPQPPYIPLHVTPTQWFFQKEDYQSLQGQFESMRPLIPKTRVEDPVLVINNILGQYGEVFGITERKTKDIDHPALIQQEAIELQQLEKSYKNYTTTTAGEYQHAEISPANTAAPPQSSGGTSVPNLPVQPDALSTGSSGMNSQAAMTVSNPTSTGEELTDPFTKGLRGLGGGSRIPLVDMHGTQFFKGRSGFGSTR